MLILASNSATRAKILQDARISFSQKGVDFDEESINASTPEALVYKIAKGKFHRFTELFGKCQKVLCADTVVVCDGRVLGKAKERNDARKMLELQSGNRVDILTAMIYSTPTLYLEELAKTSYLFKPYDLEEMNMYLDSNEWEGKAGACMVEGFCKPYIQNVIGFESTAKGLCVETLRPFLEM